MKQLLIILLATVLSGCTSLIRPNYTQQITELRPGQYQLDKMHSYILFRIDHLGLSKIVGRFNTFNASLDFNPDNITAMALNGIIDSNSIDINNDDLESTLQEGAWFDSMRFPQITFTSQLIEPRDDGTIDITGDLTLRGITRPVVLNTTFNGGADNLITRKYTIGFSASAQIKRSAYGMDSFEAFVGDDIEIELHGEFLRQ